MNEVLMIDGYSLISGKVWKDLDQNRSSVDRDVDREYAEHLHLHESSDADPVHFGCTDAVRAASEHHLAARMIDHSTNLNHLRAQRIDPRYERPPRKEVVAYARTAAVGSDVPAKAVLKEGPAAFQH